MEALNHIVKNFVLYGLGSEDSSLVQSVKELFENSKDALRRRSVPYNVDDTNIVLIYDNEPRNKEIVKLMGQGIKKFATVIWPNNIYEKDINGNQISNDINFTHPNFGNKSN